MSVFEASGVGAYSVEESQELFLMSLVVRMDPPYMRGNVQLARHLFGNTKILVFRFALKVCFAEVI